MRLFSHDIVTKLEKLSKALKTSSGSLKVEKSLEKFGLRWIGSNPPNSDQFVSDRSPLNLLSLEIIIFHNPANGWERSAATTLSISPSLCSSFFWGQKMTEFRVEHQENESKTRSEVHLSNDTQPKKEMIMLTILTMMEIVMTSFRRAASILVLVLVLNVMKLMMTTMMGVRWWRWRTTMVMMGVRCGLPTVSIQSGRLHTGKRQRCWVHHPQYILTIYKQYIQNIYTHNILYTLNNIELIYHIFTIFSRRVCP